MNVLIKHYDAKNHIHLIYKYHGSNFPDYSFSKLTHREIQIMNCTLRGMRIDKISEEIGISYSCVRRHKENMLARNNCTSIIEFVSKLYKASRG